MSDMTRQDAMHQIIAWIMMLALLYFIGKGLVAGMKVLGQRLARSKRLQPLIKALEPQIRWIAAAMEQHGQQKARLAVMRGEAGVWPKVASNGNGFVLIATHESPRYAKAPKSYAMWTGAAVFIYCMTKPDGFAGGIIFGLIAAFASYPLWKIYHRVRLKITVEDGGATWKLPDGKEFTLKPNEDFETVAIPHRDGPKEALDHVEIRQKKPKAKLVAIYQRASEAILNTGSQKQLRWTIAEIADDTSRNLASALSSTLLIAIGKSREAVEEERAKTRAGVGGSNLNDR